MLNDIYGTALFVALIVLSLYLALRLYIHEQVLHGLKELHLKPEKTPTPNPLFALVGWALLLLIGIQAVDLLLAQVR